MPLDLRELYDHHAPALFAFVLNLTRSEPETRDVLQELFLKIAKHPDQLAVVREPRAWLLRLAHHLAIDAHRRRASRQQVVARAACEAGPLFAATSDPDESAFRAALATALGELPAEQRVVVHLKLWEGFTFAEIAAALDIPANTAASRYRYALDKLQTHLRPIYEELQ